MLLRMLLALVILALHYWSYPLQYLHRYFLLPPYIETFLLQQHC